MDYSGKLLIATPSLRDPNFQQTVILLIQGDDESGVLGLILNRQLDKTISELWESVFQTGCVSQSMLHLGGPVFGALTALYSGSSTIESKNFSGEMEVIAGVYFTGTKERLEELVQQKNGNSRFFVGNAGWGEGQLAKEIVAGAWYLTDASPELVFADELEIWQHLMKVISRDILCEILHTKKIPDDPNLN